MSVWISLINAAVVSLFGGILSASFSAALRTRRNHWLFGCGTIIVLLLQGWMYSVWDVEFLRRIYPLITHLPLFLILVLLTRKPLWSLFSVLTAYLCCQLRRWLALLTVAMLNGGAMLQDIVELLVTLPLLVFLLRVVSPAVRRLGDQPAKLQFHFGAIPLVYYAFDYVTVVYTDLLRSGMPVVVEFMPFVCCGAHLVFLQYYSEKERKQEQLRQAQKSLDIQLRQSVREIQALRESQTLARQYRHDLRHHLQYISSCIENGQGAQAQSYISNICEQIDGQKVVRYCENEAANLILSAFAARAEKDGIAMHVRGTLPPFILVSDADLCILLSNALENALHACQNSAAGAACEVDVEFYMRREKLFLQITNPCETEVRFEKGLPVSDRSGHGIGVESICAIVQRYGGICSFSQKENRFIFRLSI